MADMKVYHNSFYAMGSRFNVVFPKDDEDLCEKLYNSIYKEVVRIETMLSYFDPQSITSKVNMDACKHKVHINDEFCSIIETCFLYHDLTYGAFDITMRSVLENHESRNSVVDSKNSYFDDIDFDKIEKTIFFKNNNVKIDFGAFGKGYALEKIKILLDNAPLEYALLSFAESSIVVKGIHPRGNEWQIGIKDLYNSNNAACVVNLNDNSLSTSSNYFIDDSGVLQNKINVVNPFTGNMTEGISTISVVSKSPLVAEILSTAFLILDDEQIKSVLKKKGNIEAVKIDYYDGCPTKKIFKQE